MLVDANRGTSAPTLKLGFIASVGLAMASCGVTRQTAPTLAIADFVHQMESRRGEIVRVCGAIERRQGPNEWLIVDTSEVDALFHGPPRIKVISASGSPPRPDRRGCIMGKVARKDGSTEARSTRIRTSAPTNVEWYLHTDF